MWQSRDKNKSPKERTRWQTEKSPLASVIFFICIYLYLWQIVDPKLIYHSFGVFYENPVFYKGVSFLKDFLHYPGGLIGYFSAFLSQLYYYSWLGALIITLVAWGLYLGTKKLIVLAGGGENLSFVSYIPVLILLISYNNYYHSLTAYLVILTALLFSVVHEKISTRTESFHLILFLLEFVLVYYIAAGTAFLFMIITIAFELFIRRRLISSGLFLAAAFISVGVIGYYFSGLEIEQSYLYLTPFYKTANILLAKNPARIITICLYIFFPAVFLSVLLWHNVIRPKRPVRKDGVDLHGRLKLATCIASLIITSVATIYFSFSGIKRDSCRTIYLTERQMWPQLLKHVKNLPPERYNLINIQCANRALYHTGRLAEDMFSYPQKPGSLFSLLNIINGIYGRVGSSVLVDLGYINYAEKRVYESFEDIGDDPFLLQRLVLINLVKGQTQTARIFLNVQAKDLIYGEQAKALLHRLDADPQLTTDEEIRYLRSIMPTEGFIFSMQKESEARETLLLNLLKRNRHNKMAFEYLMAEYLLANQLDKFVQNLWRLDDFNYPEIPCHYEEAILYYSNLTGRKVDLKGRKISSFSFNRFAKFINTVNRFMPDKEAAYNALVKDFGGSYLFYNAFGVSGAGK
jgi:hypothetical protein